MSNQPAPVEFVDHSLREALRGSFPTHPFPVTGLRLVLGAGAVSPADWVCLDDNEDYPELDPFTREEVLCSGRGRIRADVADLGWVGNGRCSAVYAHHVLEHLPVTSQRAALGRWADLLGPGGVLYLCQPDLAAVCARTLEALQPGAAEPWFAADPAGRSVPGELPGRRAGLGSGDGEYTSHYWLYLGGDHRSVPSAEHIRAAVVPRGVALRAVRRDLSRWPEALRLFVSLEGCYVGVKERA